MMMPRLSKRWRRHIRLSGSLDIMDTVKEISQEVILSADMGTIQMAEAMEMVLLPAGAMMETQLLMPKQEFGRV